MLLEQTFLEQTMGAILLSVVSENNFTKKTNDFVVPDWLSSSRHDRPHRHRPSSIPPLHPSTYQSRS